MAAIQYDGVDATLTFPDAGVEESDILSLSGGALLAQNYKAVFPDAGVEDSNIVSLSDGAILAQNYTASIPLYGEPTVSEGTKEFWG